MRTKILKFILAWWFLHVLMNLKWPSQEPLWPDGLRLSPEIVALLGVLCMAAWLRQRLAGWVFAGLSAAVLVLRLFRLGETVTITYLNRQLNLYADPFLLPALLDLLQRSLIPAPAILYAAAGMLTVLLLWIAIERSLRASFALFSTTGGRRLFGGLLAVFLSTHVWLHATTGNSVFGPDIVNRVAAEIATLFHIPDERQQIHREVAAADPTCSRPLFSLGNGDVYLIFVESYGHAVYARPDLFSRIRTELQNFEAALKRAGFSAASGFLSAPTYGGGSWLSHATVATGVHANNQLRYDLLIESDARPLSEYFHQAGYRTIQVMPATIYPWPEGSFFGFRETYYHRQLDYRGPSFGWSPMPDQFVFDFIARKVISSSRQPLFIEFVLTSVHAPFHRQPPYLADWSKIGDGGIYHHLPSRRYPITWPDLSNAAIAYTDALKYEFKVLAGFILQQARGEALVLVLGDHQPARQITGADPSWSVPVHAISRSPDLLRPFFPAGLAPGVIPDQPPPHKGMEFLRAVLLQGYCGP
jgi:hypothetical protein